MRVLVAVHDLMFTSKIHAAAKGHELSWLPRGSSVAEKVREAKPELLLIDLAAPALKAVEAIAAIKAAPETKDVHVIGYIGHEQADAIAAAKAAGCDEVFSKGEFARRLPELLGSP